MPSLTVLLCSEWNLILWYFPNTDLPANPENLHVVNTEKGQISLAWTPTKETADAPVDGYVIEIASGISNDFQEIGKVEGNTLCTFDATGLKEGQKYNFRIKSQNRSGTSSGYATLDKPVVASKFGKGFLFILFPDSVNFTFLSSVSSLQ